MGHGVFPLRRSVGNRLLYPLVFIVSESHRSGASSSNLFTKTAINNMDIHNIRYIVQDFGMSFMFRESATPNCNLLTFAL